MPSPPEVRRVVRRTHEVPFSRLDDEFLAIDAQAGYCYSLNETAGKVWKLIATPRQVKDICDHLRRQYDIDEATCLEEVGALLESLREAGLVRFEDVSHPR